MLKMKEKYSDEGLLENYNRFIEFVKKVFQDNPNRLEKLLTMYGEGELGEELLMAPASGSVHFHSAYPGGYIDHVMNVCKNTYRLKKMFEEEGGNITFTNEELFFAALHHDLGKLGKPDNPYYVEQDSQWHREKRGQAYKRNPELHYMDVTHRALWMLNQYGITYSEEEMLGIMLADGLFNEATKQYFINYTEGGFLKTELPYILHLADLMSTRIELGQYNTWLEENQ